MHQLLGSPIQPQGSAAPAASPLLQILMAVRNKASPASVALVSATMSKAVKKVVQAALPDVVQLQTSSTHKAVAGSRHEFTSVPPGRDRLDMLRDIIEPEVRAWQACCLCVDG